MKIIVDYNQVNEDILIVEDAKYLGNYMIEVCFNDGKVSIVDFKEFLSKSLHPSLKKYFLEKSFSEFKIIDGNLNWNDYEMIFPVSDLYKGKI